MYQQGNSVVDFDMYSSKHVYTPKLAHLSGFETPTLINCLCAQAVVDALVSAYQRLQHSCDHEVFDAFLAWLLNCCEQR